MTSYGSDRTAVGKEVEVEEGEEEDAVGRELSREREASRKEMVEAFKGGRGERSVTLSREEGDEERRGRAAWSRATTAERVVFRRSSFRWRKVSASRERDPSVANISSSSSCSGSSGSRNHCPPSLSQSSQGFLPSNSLRNSTLSLPHSADATENLTFSGPARPARERIRRSVTERDLNSMEPSAKGLTASDWA
jgi:hypothetical protein